MQIPNGKECLTLITPCCRPQDLQHIYNSIRWDYVQSWILVFDGKHLGEFPPESTSLCVLEPKKIHRFLYKDLTGMGNYGNPQRNFALDFLEQQTQDHPENPTPKYLYFLDDDNILHPRLYDLLDRISGDGDGGGDGKFYTFHQRRLECPAPDHLLKGDSIAFRQIDTAMILLFWPLCREIRWRLDSYQADFYYIDDCTRPHRPDKHVVVDYELCYYNYLRS